MPEEVNEVEATKEATKGIQHREEGFYEVVVNKGERVQAAEFTCTGLNRFGMKVTLPPDEGKWFVAGNDNYIPEERFYKIGSKINFTLTND